MNLRDAGEAFERLMESAYQPYRIADQGDDWPEGVDCCDDCHGVGEVFDGYEGKKCAFCAGRGWTCGDCGDDGSPCPTCGVAMTEQQVTEYAVNELECGHVEPLCSGFLDSLMADRSAIDSILFAGDEGPQARITQLREGYVARMYQQLGARALMQLARGK